MSRTAVLKCSQCYCTLTGLGAPLAPCNGAERCRTAGSRHWCCGIKWDPSVDGLKSSIFFLLIIFVSLIGKEQRQSVHRSVQAINAARLTLVLPSVLASLLTVCWCRTTAGDLWGSTVLTCVAQSLLLPIFKSSFPSTLLRNGKSFVTQYWATYRRWENLRQEKWALGQPQMGRQCVGRHSFSHLYQFCA